MLVFFINFFWRKILFRTKFITALFIFSFIFSISTACRDRTGSGKPFTIALDGKFSTLDPIGSTTVTANDERLQNFTF